MNILIAEDNPILQLLDAECMQVWGFAFDLASNGVEAIAYVQRNRSQYDLCLMDVEMPVMNGIEATRKIREKGAYFPIAALTARAVGAISVA